MVDDAAAQWLRSSMELWWWRLPAEHFRIALTIYARALPTEGGRRVLVTTHDNLAALCGVDRGVIRRALTALEVGGFCKVASERGQKGKTTIDLLERRWERETSNHLEGRETTTETSNVGAISTNTSSTSRPFETSQTDHLQGIENTTGSRRKPDVLNQLKTPDPTNSLFLEEDLSDLRSDLRSSDLPERSSDLEILRSEISPEKRLDTEPPKKARKPRPDKATREAQEAESIPERAWSAADYLREQIIAETPGAKLAGEEWGGKRRKRMAWARSFSRLHATLATAAKVLPLDVAGSSAVWDEIAKTVFWLFNRQTDSRRFVVLAPDKLAERWDAIQAVRRNNARPTPRPGAAPDNRPPPELTRWDPSDPWGDNRG